MKEKITKLIKDLKCDIKELDAEIRAKSSKLAKLQSIVINLENILKGEE